MSILRLKEVLNEKNISGKDLAENVGVTPASISNIVQGNSFPKPELLINIANYLDVDVKDLFFSTKENIFETIYVHRDSSYIAIGQIKKEL